MNEKQDDRENGAKGEAERKSITRRDAIKRIAAVLGGAVVAGKIADEFPPGPLLAYLSNRPYNPYADSVYGSSRGGYYSITYYNNAVRHYSSVPPPYSSRK